MKLHRSWSLALCLVGLGALLVLPSLGIGFGSVFGFLLLLICPLSHFFMMRGGHGDHDGHPHSAAPADPLGSVGPSEASTRETTALEG